ncbi:threonine synthase [Tuanshanicoccus lijuaniae]|uniref:threonine synthase n=1 Tax=Aerococcaceae bacterium zg-1292 TaxID=2774330 RepID=UPI001935AFB0|nr:threonine synthase [Aerococcaceae bacterium zg-1292]QQA37925.1 threonine synthase [Aerococcaceae bacterium zg-1292]
MSNIVYQSTRDHNNRVSASQAILKGIAEDGGLYIPTTLPSIRLDWESLKDASYQEIAKLVIGAFLTDFTVEEIAYCVDAAYDDKFDDQRIAPVVKLQDNAYVLELFHGNTIAFKDMALSILPYLLTTAAKKHQLAEDIVILTATSGDTGKAAMAGFADVPGTKIIVFYPDKAVSKIQELQMTTQMGENTHVVAIKGNFDDAQTAVKAMFNDATMIETVKALGYQFSSANSINIGRLVPQVAYYVYAYAQLVKQSALSVNELMDVVVPTGNFGNILAAYYAKQIGTPIRNLICASNQNNVLVDFFNKGVYNRQRPFYVTNSPSMDILVSSNLERLIYHLTGENTDETSRLMQQLMTHGHYTITESMQHQLSDFFAYETSQAQTISTIKEMYEATNYTLDPHTAVAVHAYQQYQGMIHETVPTIIAATASPFKFPTTMMSALDETMCFADDFDSVQQLHEQTGIAIPSTVAELTHLPVRHQTVCEISEMQDTVLSFLED